MRSIEKLTASMFPEIYNRLLHEFSPSVPVGVYQRAFVPRGWHDEDHFGYVLLDGGRPVGMLGTLFSRRQVQGKEVRFCNLHNWYVQPDYRASSLLLMRPVLALRDCLVTDFSPSGEVLTISERLGFSRLDRTMCLLPPLPWRSSQATLIDLNAEPDSADKWLNAAEQTIFRDHQGIECEHLVISSEQGNCYLVASRIPGRWLPHVIVHYLSNPIVFARQHALARAHLLRGGSRYVAVNLAHLAGVRVPCSFLADGNQRLVRGLTCPPEEINSLYSEVALFKLPASPRPPRFLRQVARRLQGWRQKSPAKPPARPADPPQAEKQLAGRDGSIL